MGYTTEFKGRFEFNKPISKELAEYINLFSETRHMKRDNKKIKEIYPDWKNRCFFGCLGKEGEFFLDPEYDYSNDESIININTPPSTQLSLWCQWEVSSDRKYLQWNSAEKFYCYIEWLQYIIENFIKTDPNGYVLNGQVFWQGENARDKGVLEVNNNEIFWYPE